MPGLTDLPPEILHAVACAAGADAVVRGAAVSRAWRAALDSPRLWRELCALEWEDKEHIDVVTVERHGLLAACPSASGVHVSEGSVVAPARASRAPPAKRQRVAEAPAGEGAGRHARRRAREAEDASETVPGSWKEWYFAARADSKRTVISAAELCSLTWAFRMRPPGEAVNPWDPPPEGCDEVHDFPVYSADRTYKSSLFQESMPWSFVTADADDGAAPLQPGEVRDKIRVGTYPPLLCSRNEAWGWYLRNVWVTFESLDMDHAEVMAELQSHQRQAPAVKPGATHPGTAYAVAAAAASSSGSSSSSNGDHAAGPPQ